MKMALKIWRYDPVAGERALREYEVDAPDWATLLDVLDIVKDKHDGSLAYRKSCRMMICGSCGMRMDGAAVLACKTRMVDIAESGHVPVISAMGNMPIVKDLVVDMEPFWGKIRSVSLGCSPATRTPARRSTSSRRRRWTSFTRSRSASCAAAVSPSATRWRRTPTSSARRRSPRACASSATHATGRRSSGFSPTPASTGSGTARAATSARSGVRKASTHVTRSRSSAPRR